MHYFALTKLKLHCIAWVEESVLWHSSRGEKSSSAQTMLQSRRLLLDSSLAPRNTSQYLAVPPNTLRYLFPRPSQYPAAPQYHPHFTHFTAICIGQYNSPFTNTLAETKLSA